MRYKDQHTPCGLTFKELIKSMKQQKPDWKLVNWINKPIEMWTPKKRKDDDG